MSAKKLSTDSSLANSHKLSRGATSVAVPTRPIIGTPTASGLGASVPFTPSAIGAAVTSYTVISTPDSITATGSSSPISIGGLSAGTTYTFQVRANNANGSSLYSDASSSITTGTPANTWTLKATYNSSGTYTPSANGFYLAVVGASAGVAGAAGPTGSQNSRPNGGNGGRSGSGGGFKDYSLSSGGTYNITVGTNTSIYSNANSTTLASYGSSATSNVAGAVNRNSVSAGTGGIQGATSGGNGTAGNAGAANGTVNLSDANISTITVYGSGGGGGGGACSYSGSYTGGAGGAAGTGGGSGGAGGNSNYNVAKCSGSSNAGSAGNAGSTPGGGGGGGGGGGVVSANQGIGVGIASGGAGGNAGSGRIYIYER